MTPCKGKAVALEVEWFPDSHLTDTGSVLELETRSLVFGKVLTPRKDLPACSSGLQGSWAVGQCISSSVCTLPYDFAPCTSYTNHL